jgi:hypothetical protein
MVKVEKIVLKIGERELELSPEEVKELKEVLDKMFGDEKIVHHYYPHYPYYYPSYPTYPPTWTYVSATGNTSLYGSMASHIVKY